jgi:hydroxymethylglutaryl-CoA synthase
MDTAQGRPGDALEYTAAAGGAAYVLGAADESLAVLEGSYSFVSDTPDFWRRPHQRFPRHGGRFTGQPAYFRHSIEAAQHLMDELGYEASDFAYAVFHQPNLRFPVRAARQLGFEQAQYETGLLSGRIGNTYAGSSLIGLSAVLDVAEPGQRILHVSFGSGAGSDAFCWTVQPAIEAHRDAAPTTEAYIARRKAIDYALYARYRRILHTD